MARLLAAALLSCSLGALGIGCGAVGELEDPGVATGAEALELTESTPNRVVGTYTRDGIKVSFASIREGIPTFVLRDADGNVLVSTAGDADGRVMTVLDRYTLRANAAFDPAVIKEVPATPSGDSGAFATLLLSKEAGLLPHLSRALGQRGLTGATHPASFDLHSLGMIAGKVHDVALDPLPGQPGEFAGESACGRSPGADKCFGMCGKGCGCWSWICGDCCYHKGCAAHDRDCRDCSWSNPGACAKCASFTSFYAGGRCAVW